ncbi:3-deoxy-7-phosphoheptulonate synthase [Patescibacteria group bacterium]
MGNKLFKLSSRESKKKDTIVKVGKVGIGGNTIVVMAGPCSIEAEKQLIDSANVVKQTGGKILRGGAFKPRSSPFNFQGLGEKGLKLLIKAKQKTGLPLVSEVMDSRDVPLVSKYVDILQIGARNMQNYTLLTAVGKSKKPVLLKRGLSATIEEWLATADYILKEKNPNVILCERGIRTFETKTRFTLDVSSIPVVKKLSHLPIIIDPSHAAGNRDFVPSLAKAGLAGGADGLLIEIHPNPEKALSDGPQALTFLQFKKLMKDLRILSKAIGKKM